MPNCPAYVAIWLGITRVGCVVSLLNTNLVGDSLAHAIRIVEPKHVRRRSSSRSFRRLMPKVSLEIQAWTYGENIRGLSRIDDEIEGRAGEGGLAGSEYKPPTIADRALYIYTSGTTGLPKAVNVSHFRLMQWSHWFAGIYQHPA